MYGVFCTSFRRIDLFGGAREPKKGFKKTKIVKMAKNGQKKKGL